MNAQDIEYFMRKLVIADEYNAWDDFANGVLAPFVYLEEHNQQYAIYIDYLNLLDRKFNLN